MWHIRPPAAQGPADDPQRECPLLMDVREPWELDHCHIEGAFCVPIDAIPVRLAELPRDRRIVVICHHGVRRNQVARFLDHNGFARVINRAGRVDALAKEVDPTMPTN